MYDIVKSRLDANRAELTHLEEAVADQMDTKKPAKKRKKANKKNAPSSGASTGALSDPGFEINLDDLEFSDDSDG